MVRPDVSDRDWGRRAFSKRSRAVVRALAEAFFSEEDDVHGLRPARTDLVERVIDSLDLLIGAGSPDLRRGFRLLLFAAEWLPLFVIRAPSRATRLPLARRVAYLEALERSRRGVVTMLLVALKAPLAMVAYETGPELRLTGFDRPDLASSRRRPMVRGGVA